MNVCEKHKNEREARGPERTEREARRSNRAPQARSNLRAKGAARKARDENVPAKRADFFHFIRLKLENINGKYFYLEA